MTMVQALINPSTEENSGASSKPITFTLPTPIPNLFEAPDLIYSVRQGTAVLPSKSGEMAVTEEGNHEIWEIPAGAKTRYLSHDYFRYIGKFPPQIPREIILAYSKSGDLVLDPMCGGGTVLIESRLLGRRSMGIDVNPVSLLISRVTTRSLPAEKLQRSVREFLETLNHLTGAQSSLPFTAFAPSNITDKRVMNMHGHEKYFDTQTLSQLRIALNLIDEVEDEHTRDFLLLGLMSILRHISHANVKKMNLELDMEKKTRKPLFQALSAKLHKMAATNDELIAHFSEHEPTFTQTSATESGIADGIVDLVIAHPPYITNTAFSEVTQLQLSVLGTSHKDIWKKELRARGSFMHEPDGVRKYLVGWNKALKEMYRVLKPGGFCCVVVGDGQVDFTRIPVGVFSEEIGSDIGFKVVKRARHRLNNNTGRTLSHKMRDQHLIVFEK